VRCVLREIGTNRGDRVRLSAGSVSALDFRSRMTASRGSWRFKWGFGRSTSRVTVRPATASKRRNVQTHGEGIAHMLPSITSAILKVLGLGQERASSNPALTSAARVGDHHDRRGWCRTTGLDPHPSQRTCRPLTESLVKVWTGRNGSRRANRQTLGRTSQQPIPVPV